MPLVKRGHAVSQPQGRLRAVGKLSSDSFQAVKKGNMDTEYPSSQINNNCFIIMLSLKLNILSFFLINVGVAHVRNYQKRSCPLLFISDCICYNVCRICLEMLCVDTGTLSTDPYILVFCNLQLHRITYCQVVIFSHLL